MASEGFLGNVSQLDDYCREKGFAGWYETSAKENLGIDEAARCLVAKVREIVCLIDGVTKVVYDISDFSGFMVRFLFYVLDTRE